MAEGWTTRAWTKEAESMKAGTEKRTIVGYVSPAGMVEINIAVLEQLMDDAGWVPTKTEDL